MKGNTNKMDNMLFNMIIEHDNTLVYNTIHAVEIALYEHGQYDPIALKLTLNSEDLKRALYQVIEDMRED